MTIRQPNILLVVLDCARADKTIGPVPKPVVDRKVDRTAHMPALRHLWEDGWSCTNYNAVSSTTTPNFATMLTGLPPYQHGIQEHSGHALRTDVRTLPEILGAAGYSCHAFVTGPLKPATGLGRGFDTYNYRSRGKYLYKGYYKQWEEAMEGIEGRKPWFVMLHAWEAHTPYQGSKVYTGATPYDRALTLLDEKVLEPLVYNYAKPGNIIIVTADHGERLGADYIVNGQLGGNRKKVFDAWQYFMHERKGEHGLPAWYDYAKKELGPVLARIYSHTVKTHGMHVTEELVRIPLVIWQNQDEWRSFDSPLVGAGSLMTVSHCLTTQRDLAGTIVHLCGAQAPSRAFKGNIISQGLNEPGPGWVYVEANGSGGLRYAPKCYLRGVKTDEGYFPAYPDSAWKYCRMETDGGFEHRELYDLKKDPREVKNVAGKFREIIGSCDRLLDIELKSKRSPGRYDKAIRKQLKGLGYVD